MVGFLDLPGELRNKIYRYCFILETPILIQHCKQDTQPRLQPLFVKAKASSQLFETCRQIYNEGTPVLYGENYVHAGSLLDLKQFIEASEWRSLRDLALGYITKLTIQYFGYFSQNYRHVLSTISPFTRLRVLRFFPGGGKLMEGLGALPKPLEPGEKVPNKDSSLVPQRLPLLPKDLMTYITAKVDLQVFMLFLHTRVIGVNQIETRMDRYQVVPTAASSSLNSSLIEQNFDLVYVDSKLSSQ